MAKAYYLDTMQTPNFPCFEELCSKNCLPNIRLLEYFFGSLPFYYVPSILQIFHHFNTNVNL